MAKEIIIEKELLLSLYYGEEYNIKEISKIFNCDRQTIQRKLKKYHIQSKGKGKDIIIEKELLESLYWGNEYSTRKIGEIFNCYGTTIHSRLIEYDIPRREISEWMSGKNNHQYVDIEPEILWGLYWGENLSIIKISSLFKCHEVTILYKLNIYDIPIKPIDERMPRGPNHYNWIEDRTKLKMNEIRILKSSYKWKEWRKQIFERDGYHCKICHEIGGKLHPHHIKAKANYPELMFNIDNGITLCKDCHMWVHHLNPLDFQ